MPSYCCAVNCKNNGVTNPDLSYFKFPINRQDLNNQWIDATQRANWKPTEHSRLCSVHFDENCFSSNKKETARLRLLADAVPTIFDFRKIKSNRKKAVNYLNMNESDCPDPELYELKIEPVLSKTAKSGQKCLICSNVANCDLTVETVVATSKGRVAVADILKSMGVTLQKKFKYSSGFICLECSKRLVDAYVLQCNVKENENFSITNAQDASFLSENNVSDNDVDIKPSHQLTDENIVYCSACDTNFMITDIASHLLYCKMKDEADLAGIPSETRRLFVCCLCQFLVYKHNAVHHMENCCTKII